MNNTEKILTERIISILNEQEEESSFDNCAANKRQPNNTNLRFWQTLPQEKKQVLVNNIHRDIVYEVKKSIQEYNNWFRNPKTLQKFKKNEIKVVQNIPKYLSQITNIKLYIDTPSHIGSTVIAWVSSLKPDTINYSLPQIHDGKRFIGTSIYETTKHEIGHLIDYYFKKNKIKTYLTTINTDNPEDYQTHYIVNDSDQYTRLNVLRKIINAGPADSPELLLKKFMSKVNDNTISSNVYKFSAIKSKTPSKKNNTEQAKQMNNKLRNTIIVNNRYSLNLEQLFSTFSLESNGIIYVNFNLISQLNYTSKALDVYYLKLEKK